MKAFKLIGAAAAASLLLLTSCLGESNNTVTRAGFGVAGLSEKTYKTVLNTNMGALYSPSLSAQVVDGACYLINYELDLNSPENANAATNGYTDQVESFGLDEAWLDITGSVGLFGSPVKIAKEISVRIKRELGITVSIGVSFNKITAKLGSDYKKPDAITVIEPDTYKQIVYPLPVGDLLYVGNATQRKLGSYGIRTSGQLAETNPEVLKGWFGVMGYTLSAFARGLDQTPVAKQDAHSAIKSVGNSATTPRDLTTDEDVWLMLVLLSESVAMRMRDLGSKCNVVEIYVRDNELSGFTRRRKLDNPTNVSIEIARIAFDLFKRNYSWPKPLRGIGVRGADLCPADCAVQLGFFSNEEKREKLEHIDKAVDTLRQRYGYRSVQRAVVYTDPVLGGINAYDDHNIHPVGYFHTA